MPSPVRGTRWCFTLNNYSPEDVDHLKTLFGAKAVKFIVFGEEVAPETGTPHLQGYFVSKTRIPLSQAKILVGNQTVHLELAKGSQAQNIEYCSKGNNVYSEGSEKRKRSDLEEFKDAVKEGSLTVKEIREQHSEVYAKYPRFCYEYIIDQHPTPELEEHPLKNWQKDLNTMLNREPDARTIVFVVDKKGNCGKTWFAGHYQSLHSNVQRMKPGRKADMAYMLQLGTRVLFMDAPRSKQGEYIQYDFLEELKDGFVQSGKYESCQKLFKKMHVVVFMNEDPDMTKLSADRYKIINITEASNRHDPAYLPNVNDE